MRKFMIFVLAVLGAHWSSNAQNIHFGVKGGLNLANISGDYTEDLKTRTAFHVGALAEILVLDQLYFQPELLYSAQGAKGDKMDATYKLDYIQVPIMAKYFLIDNLSMELGPQLSFLVNSDFEFDGDTSVSIEPKDLYKKMDFGLNFGLSYKLNKIFFSGRYNLGLTQLLEGELVQDIIQHNRGFQFSVGYMF